MLQVAAFSVKLPNLLVLMGSFTCNGAVGITEDGLSVCAAHG